MADSNTDQIEFWAGTQGQKWLRLQESIDRMMHPFTDAGLAALGDIGGAHCLDVGCGCGDTSLALAGKAGPDGSVTGIDVSTPMLHRARDRAEGRSTLCFVEADAQTYEFPADRFDIVFSRFGIMFFHDPAQAFANLRHACKPGGRLVAITWREPRENPWVMVPVSVAKEFVELPGRPAPGDPGQFQWADPGLARGWLEAAGWSESVFEPLNVTLAFPGPPRDVARFLLQMGPAAALLQEKGHEAQEAAEATLGTVLEDHVRDGVVALDAACWTVSATA